MNKVINIERTITKDIAPDSDDFPVIEPLRTKIIVADKSEKKY